MGMHTMTDISPLRQYRFRKYPARGQAQQEMPGNSVACLRIFQNVFQCAIQLKQVFVELLMQDLVLMLFLTQLMG